MVKNLVDSVGDLNKKYKTLEENFGALNNKLNTSAIATNVSKEKLTIK